MKFGLIDNRQL